MSMVDFGKLDTRQEVCALALIIMCPCGARIMAMGPALQEVMCPKCERPYSKNTRNVMRECYERNTSHKG
jgi:hypothetical protein